MEITATDLYPGPSIHAQRPVARYTLGQFDPLPPSPSDRYFLDALHERLPGLAAHWQGCTGRPTGDAPPFELNHLFEHVCIELLRQSGGEADCVRAQQPQRIAANQAIVACDEARITNAASKLAAELFTSLSPAEPPAPGADTPSFEFVPRLAKFIRFAERTMLPVQDRELVKRAGDRDVPVTRLIGRIIQLGQGRHQQRMSATKTTLTNVVSNDIAANKDYARRILEELGLPTPRSDRVYDVEEAVAAARRIGYPVVVKPNEGSMGGGVSVGMKNQRDVRAAFGRAREICKSVLVEEVVEGSDYRMLVVNGELLAAAERIPGHVVGDGVQTIKELVAELNRDPRRGTGPLHSWTRIKLDDQAERLLSDLGYTRRSIPSEGQVVFLRRNANTSDGGTAVDVTDVVHPDNRAIAVRAAKAIGLDVAGVDFLTADITRSMWKTGGRICEINSRPGLRKHIWPAEGEPRDVVTPIIDMLFPKGTPSRVPIVAVTGTGDTRTTARMLAQTLEANGHHVGLSVKRRVYIGGRRTGPSRLAAPAAARMILLDPDVDVAVLEITPNEVLRHGLGCDAIDVSLVVDVAPGSGAAPGDPTPTETIDAIRVVARTTRDVILMSAGDAELRRALALDSGSATLCPIMTPSSASESHPDPNGEASRRLVSDGEVLRAYDRGELGAEIPLAAATDDSDSVSRGRAHCALFAIAAAHALGMKPRKILRGISRFEARAARSARRRSKKAARAKASVQTPALEEVSG